MRVVFLFLANLLLFSFELDVADVADEDSGKDDAHNAERVSAGVA